MAADISRELSHIDYEYQYPLRSYAGHPSHPHDPTYQAITPEGTVMLPMQYVPFFNTSDDFHQTTSLPPTTLPTSLMPSHATNDCYPHVTFSLIELPTLRPQPIRPSHTGKIVGTVGRKNSSKDEGRENPQVHNTSISRKLIPQDIYTLPRRQRKSVDPNTIEFIVHGEKGIRLSDALEGRWDGFEGRDDRFLFEDDRVQITLRLLVVGCPSWDSKISTVDYTATRQPNTREKLARDVAKSVKRFLEREQKGHGDDSECKWQDAFLSDMYLTHLFRVSAGSWQPEIFVVQPSVPATPTSSST